MTSKLAEHFAAGGIVVQEAGWGGWVRISDVQGFA